MSKLLVAGLTGALSFSALSPLHAQTPFPPGRTPELLSDAVSKALIDRRIDVLKITLGLTPDQAKHWPGLEEAIRARLTARHQRLARLVGRLNEPNEVDLVELMNRRASALSERAAGLRRLADAWKPLYETLDGQSESRLRFLAAYVLREMRDAAEARRMQLEDHEDEDDSQG